MTAVWQSKAAALDGAAMLDDVPEGAATIKPWHAAQVIDLKQPQTLTLGATPCKLTVQREVVPRRRRT